MQVAYEQGTETIYDVHTDHLDTPRVLTDTAGSAKWRAAYAANGEAHVDPDPDGDGDPANNVAEFNIRFPGQFYDDETGLYYDRFRYYDPAIGRYVSADPIGQAGGVNTYRYAMNNPTYQSDPYGLDSFHVSRPVDGIVGDATGARHGFIATDANYLGDENAEVHSFGQTDDLTMGNVSDVDNFQKSDRSQTERKFTG